MNCSSNLINFKEGGPGNHSTTADLSEPQVIVGVYGWHLKYLGISGSGGRGGGLVGMSP